MKKIEKGYTDSLQIIITTIETSKVKTAIAANKQLLWAYWKIGVVLHQQTIENGWGAKTIEVLASDIKKQLPGHKGFSARNLLYMRQFAENYPISIIQSLTELWEQVKSNTQPLAALFENAETEFTQQAVAQLSEEDFLNSVIAHISWSHHIVLLDKCKKLTTRFWYMLNTIEHGVSRNILLMQLESGLFERQINQQKISNFKSQLPEPQSDFANYLLKDPYIFDFVQAKEKADERDIEKQLVDHITKFLLELGQGFAFVGKQYHINVGSNDYYIDLLFYHTKLHCYVVVELKAREFKPGDPAQLNFYINVLNDTLKTEYDNETIGILLCKGKDKVVAEYALKGYNNPIGVSDYQLSQSIPTKLQSSLPNIEELEKELQQLDNKENIK